ncbi:MAG: hypothetical protein QM658_00860 [Gordonia sp. (in: high G+C Gram-positive bacteria)]
MGARVAPELAIDIVEASLFGTTVESATAAFVARGRPASSLAELAALVNVCLLAEISVHDVSRGSRSRARGAPTYRPARRRPAAGRGEPVWIGARP